MTKEEFIKFVIEKLEGGFTMNPHDPGGATKYGITIYALRKHRGIEVTVNDVKHLTIEEAIDIYLNGYWVWAKCEHMLEPISFLHFDCAINCGVKGAGRVLQNALKQYGFRDIAIDGTIGKYTLGFMEQVTDIKTFTLLYQTERLRRYYFISGKNRKLVVFLRGWINRVAILSELISKNFFRKL